jgi:hypothetical protein
MHRSVKDSYFCIKIKLESMIDNKTENQSGYSCPNYN